ncbi:MAG: galactose-1-phosphate uridylyltransferase [Candidatus Omnitrophica bacterium]|nr:galactose-1-phosphate uridylyltransferase [Candidatus Omnitrophota bacterium]
MPELRKDPIIGRWIIIATERAKRPHDFVVEQEKSQQQECVFCEGREKDIPPEIYSVRFNQSRANEPGWKVRVIPSLARLLQIEGDMGRRGKGMYDLINGIGAHEVIIESPEHHKNIAELSIEQITYVLDTYAKRMEDLKGDKRLKYVLICKNYKEAAGVGAIKHAHTQLIALPVNPKRVKEELVGALRYYEYRERCIFCDIIRQEIETNLRIVARIDGFIAFCPYASRFPFEVWILPEEHSCDFYTIKNTRGLAKIMKKIMSRLFEVLQDPPYNYVIHTAPFRRTTSSGFWKTITHDYHWHIEIMPRLTKVAGFELGSGFYINPTPPEEAALHLKGET